MRRMIPLTVSLQEKHIFSLAICFHSKKEIEWDLFVVDDDEFVFMVGVDSCPVPPFLHRVVDTNIIILSHYSSSGSKMRIYIW